jgi:hypothetical protein
LNDLTPGDQVEDLRGSRYTVAGQMEPSSDGDLLPVIAAGDERVTRLRAEHILGLVDEDAERAELEAAAIAAVDEMVSGTSAYFRYLPSRELHRRIAELCAERGLPQPEGSMDSDMSGMHLWLPKAGD